VLKPLCETAGVPVTSSFHTTRHTYASVLLMAGEDLEWVSRQLGHKDVSTTERTYRHVLDDNRRDTERAARVSKAWAVEAKPHAVGGREDRE
jgi:integrase